MGEMAFNAPLFNLGDTTVTLAGLATLALVVVASYAASTILQRAVKRTAERQGLKDTGRVATMQRLLHYAILAIGLTVGLETVGISLSALLAAGAVFAVGIGLALQSVAQSFVSGLILLAERAIKPGDVLEVEGKLTRVVELGIRSTILQTLNDEHLVVPNSSLVEGSVRNLSYTRDPYRMTTIVGVAYASDLDLTLAALQQVADELSRQHAKREGLALLVAFGASSVDFEVSVWTRDPWSSRRLRSETHLAIWRALKEAGVTIAFPQVDVHLDPPIEEALLRLA